MDKLIKNGQVVFETAVRRADLLIRGEKIAAILEPGTYAGDAEVIDAEGLYVMPGTIDPHQHLGLYKPLGDAFRMDTPRQVVGGLTTLLNYHRGKGNYYETVQQAIEEGESNSLVDFAFSLGLCAKEHLDELQGYVDKLGITSFKFFFDKQDIAHTFYDIPKEAALTLDKADFYFILKRLREISPELLLCIHCEDADLFRALQKSVKDADLPEDRYSLTGFEKTRPGWVETISVADTMWINHVVDGNMYVVHTSAATSVEMYDTLSKALRGNVTLETCPHYLLLTKDAPCGLLGKVNPPLRTSADNEALWEGIRNGSIKTMGTDNVPVRREKRYERGDDIWGVFVGFGGPGMILPTLISEGYHKRGIPLTTLSMVNSTNAARAFLLRDKGVIAPGFDADLALVDLDWEREITPELFGDSDFSVYEGIKLKGWPRYTIGRGEILQKDGVVTAKPGRGRYIRRHVEK
ncbi:MAG: amidohydrolase family protein [Clostridia bacterium]|nr:amidohydrolase family protein [Clostridia bacterium]MBR6889718.1 amidohydrolase family protein [Clostridia bacterium]